SGSPTITNTMGIVWVARWSAAVTGVEFERIRCAEEECYEFASCLIPAPSKALDKAVPTLRSIPRSVADDVSVGPSASISADHGRRQMSALLRNRPNCRLATK